MKCEYRDPKTKEQCGITIGLTKIEIHYPNALIPDVTTSCKKHGDQLYNRLSFETKELQRDMKNNRITLSEYKSSMKDARWKKCAKCFKLFDNEEEWLLIMCYIGRNKTGFRIALKLCRECASIEMRSFGINKIPSKIHTLDIFK